MQWKDLILDNIYNNRLALGSSHPTVMPSPWCWAVDVVEPQVRTTHPKNIQAVILVAVDETVFEVLGWRNQHMGAIETPSNRRKASFFPELARNWAHIVWPLDDGSVQVRNCTGHIVHGAENSVSGEAMTKAQVVVEGVWAEEVQKHFDLFPRGQCLAAACGMLESGRQGCFKVI